MLSGEIRDSLLVDELQLGERLNSALQQNDRAEFSLLLSMLSDDLLDSPNYHSPEKEPVRDEDLRKRFGLPEAVRSYARPDDFERIGANAALMAGGGGRAVFLAQCLHPEPLVPFERELDPEVTASLTPLKQEKLRREREGRKLDYERMHERGEGFDMIGEVADSVAQLNTPPPQGVKTPQNAKGPPGGKAQSP